MNVLIAGFGVVAQALVELLAAQRARLHDEHGCDPRVVGVIDSRGAAWRGEGIDASELLEAKARHGSVSGLAPGGREIDDPAAFIARCQADVLVEATPSVLSAPGAAFERIKAAMRTGKHVVSVNKGPLAAALPALLELAAHNRVEFRFSGTVGAGTPMLDLARRCAQGDDVLRLRAIVNGTTNYILWRMHEYGDDFATALTDAQRLGYAETDPAADVDGFDTAAKLVILANHVLGRRVSIADVRIEGVRDFPRERIEQAAARGRRCKLIAEIDGGGQPLTRGRNGGSSRVASAVAELRVTPSEVEANSPENVPANLNALSLELGRGGPVTLVGRGAGGPETAVAVVRDLLDVWHATGGGA